MKTRITLYAFLGICFFLALMANPEAQNRTWVLVNGALQSSGPVTIIGTTTINGALRPNSICMTSSTLDACMLRVASGVVQLGNSATPTGFTRLILGTNDGTANGISFTNSSGTALLKTGDGSTAFVNLGMAKVTTYNSLTTAGNGVPSIVAAGSGAGISAAADTNRCTFTPGADGDFEVSDQVLVTTAGSIAATATIGYTDEGNTARTQTIPFVLVAGSAIVTAIAAANGTVPYNGIVVHIRAKSGVAINVSTAGTFTGSVYNHRCAIRQLQ